jgi:hypothetical protein
MADGFARLSARAGLYPPPSTVRARSAAMVRALGGEVGGAVGNGRLRRLAIPSYWTIDDTGTRRHNKHVKKPILADAQRVGLEVVRTDLDELRLDAAGRLLAGEVPVDLVLIPWGRGETAHIVDGCAGLAALRGADRAGTVELFPRTESALINSKVVLAWLHEDCDAALLTAADAALVRNHVPRTTALGLNGTSAAPNPSAPHRVNGSNGANGLNGGREDMVVKPALGKAGNGVLFGSQTSRRDWQRAVVDAARDAPVVLQQRVEPDRIAMPFLDQVTGQQVSAQVPFLLSPFMIDGAAADVSVRHMTPDVPAHDVVIAVDRGGCWNTVVLLADRLWNLEGAS